MSLSDQIAEMQAMGSEEWLTFLVTNIAAFFIIFGGIVPYIPQYLDIRRTKNAEGFSLFVCFVLLVANILRILFWFGRHFEMPLLLQSIIMIITMFAMVHVCTNVKSKGEIITPKPRVFSETFSDDGLSGPVVEGVTHRPHTNLSDSSGLHAKPDLHSISGPISAHFLDFDSRHFWRWTDFTSYVEFMALFSAVCGAITYFLIQVQPFVELIGFLAVFFEAMLGAPQFYRNYQNRSTKGMSLKMVLMWTSGDIFKTIYFVLREAPAQFWLCGSLQVTLDLAILGQVFYYGFRKPSLQ